MKYYLSGVWLMAWQWLSKTFHPTRNNENRDHFNVEQIYRRSEAAIQFKIYRLPFWLKGFWRFTPNNKTALSHLMRKSNSFSFKWLNYNNTRASFNFAHNLIRSNRMLKTEPKTNIEFITCYLSLTIKLTNEYELDSLSGEWDESFTPVF